jgi:broad specificity phosphatase PhoE
LNTFEPPSTERLRELAEAEEPRAGGGPAAQGLGGQLRPGEKDVTELIFIRHAQMPATTDPRTDQPLTELGLEQADVLGHFLAAKPLHAIYSSPTMRTRQTAEGIARYTGLDVVDVDDLREMEVYVPEGVDWEDFRNDPAYKALGERFQRELTWDVFGERRESSAALRGRVTRVADEVVRKHPGQRVALVTHGPLINAYVAVVSNSPYDIISSYGLTGFTVILAADDRRRIHTVNSRAHFGVV